MRKSDLRKALAHYQDISQQIAILEKEKLAEQERIKKAMGDTEEMQLDDYVIRYKEVTQSRFDTTAFKSTYQNLYNQFCKVSTTRRFTVA